MLLIDMRLAATALRAGLDHLFALSAAKLRRFESDWGEREEPPVHTVCGSYASRAWTTWTQGLRVGSLILQFDATGDEWFLQMARRRMLQFMTPYVSHIGVHDHGFNSMSSYGNLLRLMNEGRLSDEPWERRYYELALKVSGAVQAARWTKTDAGAGGYIYSFSGPHSLFVDTVRSLRVLAVAHQLGHVLLGERDKPISLLERLVRHAETTARFNVFYGENRDMYDVRGRVAHEAIFNVIDGSFSAVSTQQGFSPFTTWVRGLSWALLGFAEVLEFLDVARNDELDPLGGRVSIEGTMLRAANAVADYYIINSPADGIPYWDTGAPGLARLPDHLIRPADPYNHHEPVDSSAAAIAAQGLLRLGRILARRGDLERANTLTAAGLTTTRSLLGPTYLSDSDSHHGLLLHAVYHRPRGWDYVPPEANVPRGEATIWGDYHVRELALYLLREARAERRLSWLLEDGSGGLLGETTVHSIAKA